MGVAYPIPKNKTQLAVAQLHFRGKTAHLDLRFLVRKELTGWTVSIQKEGKVSQVDTVAQGKPFVSSFSPKGSKWNKPIISPARVWATPKQPHPIEWLNVADQVVKPGKPGSTENMPGVVMLLDRFGVEWGLQQDNVCEYFPVGSKFFQGVLLAVHPPKSDGWLLWLEQENLVPLVLRQAAVDENLMPPDGYSALPRSLMEQVPDQFRYWEQKGEAAREMRDELVTTGLFAKEPLSLVDGQIRRVERKSVSFVTADGETHEVVTEPVGKAMHRSDRCMLCKKVAPEVEILWAEGRARAWFCKKCLEVWKAESEFHQIDSMREVKGGRVGRTFQDGGKVVKKSEASDEEVRPLQSEVSVPVVADEAAPASTLLPVEKASKEKDKQIVFGVVMEPEVKDSHGDITSAEEIITAAHRWLARFQDRGYMHKKIVNGKIEIYESYIAPVSFTIGSQKVLQGTWLLMYHILDPSLWKEIKEGKITGFSIGGFARRKPLTS